MLCPRLNGVLDQVQPCTVGECAKAARRPLCMVDPHLSCLNRESLQVNKMEPVLLLTLRVLPTCRATLPSTFQLWRRSTPISRIHHPLLQHGARALPAPSVARAIRTAPEARTAASIRPRHACALLFRFPLASGTLADLLPAVPVRADGALGGL